VLRTLQNWEAGAREPRLDALVKLARTCGVSADELLRGGGKAAGQAGTRKGKGR
jgi:hypothetical protein